MLFVKEELGLINILIDSQFDNQNGSFRARGVGVSDRVNSLEVYKKIYTHVENNTFLDGEIEFNPQEKDYLKRLLSETLPADLTRIAVKLLDKINS